MPKYAWNGILEVTPRLRAFFGLQAGITSDEVLGYGEQAHLNREQALLLKDAQRRAEKQRRTIRDLKAKLDRYEARLREQKRRPAPGAPAGRAATTERWRECVVHDGVILPPRSLRPCGKSFQDDAYYLASAREAAGMLVERLGLGPESALLDVGCGPGRLAIGILEEVGEIRAYRGLDVAEDYVRWAQTCLAPRHPNFEFLHIDVENPRYNPAGTNSDSVFTFPFAEHEFDVICLYSVFTHMLADGVRSYLREFRRILRPEGRIYLTAFLEDGVPDVAENPQGYLGREWKGPLHCVRYNKAFFESMLDENGFRIVGSDVDEHQRSLRGESRDRGHRGWIVARGA